MDIPAEHRPVLLEEVMEFLKIGKTSTVIDGTFGGGGHAGEICRRLSREGLLVGIDRDWETLEETKKHFDPGDAQVAFFNGNFIHMKEYLSSCGRASADAVLLDLGISSIQLNNPERGFSFKADGPCDMRMDRRESVSAEMLINDLSEADIQNIIHKYGEARFARRIARGICRQREKERIVSTAQLRDVILKVLPPYYRHMRKDPAQAIFQAFRIAVNHELDMIETGIDEAIGLLNPGGRLCVISFHSLEDRIAKLKLRHYRENNRVTVLTKKPVTPREKEIVENPRARSAKLRAAEAIGR